MHISLIDEGDPRAHGRAGERRPILAENLQIAGLQSMSTVDWPGKLVATVFCQGCPWACPYCHNHELIDPTAPGVIEWREVESLLARRQGMLDGVVFSGGEATRQAELLDAMARVRAMGYLVGLHTAGPYPRRLADILERKLVDWVGIDVKALPGRDYELVAGRQGAGTKAWQALEVLTGYPDIDIEVRLTVYPDGPGDGLEVARRVRELGFETFAIQQARAQGAPAGFVADGPMWDAQVRDLVREVEAVGFGHLIVRLA